MFQLIAPVPTTACNASPSLACLQRKARAKRHALSRAGARNWTPQRTSKRLHFLWTETFRMPKQAR
ncbi:MAG: hypothetical protein EOS25_21290 [Mesorhizobium sp.]|nr:MAG: hypothetical protein EOS59_08205 [Mesorhizobium sp.]RWE58699.1 MAG: hypothetical protein EOS24_16985 [Mesorhizobium sp.]RWF06924.1 MAG: hypothetical protein EOS69_30990 [Mesorhizobium sp.]RWF16126.1 MAG: hypothetical protein EOS25_21290 [Mesorhizobium sp.]TIY00379.1 MAG: hypothetical protein E5V22_24460 [Mesorhizobium sp.]